MNLTALKMYFTKQKHETTLSRDYKKLENLKFKKAQNRELMKDSVNNIYYEIVFVRLCFQFLMHMHL